MIKKGDIVKCLVTGFKDFGIFVKVNEEYNGLIHISEVSEGFVRNVKDYADIGDFIYAKVIDIDESTKHLRLSIKNIHYKLNGEDIEKADKNGFEPLKKNLNIWINEKLKEFNRK